MRCVLEICNCLKRNCKDLNPPIIPCVLNSKWRKTCGCVREFKVKIDFDTSYLLSLPNPVFSIQVLLNFANGRVAKNSQALRMYVQFNGFIHKHFILHFSISCASFCQMILKAGILNFQMKCFSSSAFSLKKPNCVNAVETLSFSYSHTC